jgi:lysophospholipid acyltransferase (LPLAT)-like uncharacterized protein
MHKLFFKITGILAWLYLKFVIITSEINTYISKEAEDSITAGNGFLFCFWHNRMLMMAPAMQKYGRFTALISKHRDGDYIAAVISALGHGAIRGSSSKGAVGALREIMARLKDGDGIGIAVDGPRGPQYHMNTSINRIAEKHSIPIIIAAYSASKFWRFNSWDGFILPKPFSKIFLEFTQLEQHSDAHMKQAMLNQIKQLDEMAGGKLQNCRNQRG